MSDSSDTNVSPVLNKGKRKAVVLSDSMRESDSSSASDLGVSVKRNAKRKARIRESDSDSSIEKPKIKRIPRVSSDSEAGSSSEDDDSSEIIRKRRGRSSVRRVVLSDDSNNKNSDSSDVSDVGFEDNTSDDDDDDAAWESDWLSDSPETEAPPQQTNSMGSMGGNVSDSSSDGESEKCPICLLSFNQQEVGTPETCDHSFCAECIQEWSRNVNTCPVDRQTFTLILVRKRYNGKVIRRVPVDVRRPSEDELIHEDPTYCEICGMSDREDRLLLCDGCDLGYHLECLDPPMDTVPVEEWFCSICSASAAGHHQQQDNNHNHRVRNNEQSARLLPRTSQSERIRATIQTNRHTAQQHEAISSGFEDVSMPGTSNSTTRSNRSSNNAQLNTRKKKRTTRRRKRRTYTTTYEICEMTGEKIAIKTLKKRRRKARRRRKKKSTRRTIKPKTVKKRLAFQLGMCAPKTAGLSVPEVKVKAKTSIGFERTQAGIPTLHLFGQRDGLDYFSGGDGDSGSDDMGTGINTVGGGSARILTHSRHIDSSMSAMRRAARRKAAILSPVRPVSVNSCDILGSILDSQAKLHSKHSKISVTRDGTIHIENTNSNSNNNNNNIIKPVTNKIINNEPPPLDLTAKNTELETTQAPMFPGNRGGGNRQPYGFNRGGGGGGGGYRSNHSSGGNYNNYQSGNRGRGGNYGNYGNNPRDNFSGGGGGQGGGNYMNFHHHGGPPPYRGRGPLRFPIRRPQFPQHHQNQAQHQYHQEEENEAIPEPVDLVLDETQDQNDTSRIQEQEEQEDVDIYSDIEDNVQTQDEEETQVKPPPPSVNEMDEEGPPLMQGLVSQAYNNSDDDDSGSELVIDDTKEEKTEATTPQALSEEPETPTEQIQEEEEVKESVTEKVEEKSENRQLAPFSQQVVKQVVQEVLQEHLNTPVKKSNVEYDDDDMSNDDCPNFSIYSSTSMDIAKATDFSVDIPNDEKPENTTVATPTDEAEISGKQSTEVEAEVEAEVENENKNAEADEDEWPSGDEWDTCDAENAQKSWDQPYEQPPEDNKDVDAVKDKPEEQITQNNEEEEEKSKHEDDNESDSEEFEENEASTNTTDVKPNDNDDEDPDDNPSPEQEEAIQIPDKPNQSECLTPPLPSSLPIGSNQATVQPEKVATPIKIAFNPNTRKLQKTTPFVEKKEKEKEKEKVIQLYDDSDYEEWELKNADKTLKPNEETPTNAAELEKLTEAISEEERSYTPCLDEKDPTKLQYSEDEKNMGVGIGGMDTEMISDDERNEFDESHDMKTISDGDALEINAKESELELARPEDYEEGEIVEKAANKQQAETQNKQETQSDKSSSLKAAPVSEDEKKKRPKKKPIEKEAEKEKQSTTTAASAAEPENKSGKKSEFKKIKNKERNYRDKERSKSKEHAKGKENRESNAKEELRKKKERKRDLERYNVRSIIADKPKKDQFGRDIKSPSRSSRSVTPRRSRSHSWTRAKKRRRRSRSLRRSRSRSHSPRSRSRGRSARRSRSFRRSKSPRRSRSRSFRRSRTPKNKRHREVKSLSRERDRVRYRNRSRRSADRTQRKKKNRSTSRNRMRSRTPSPAAKHRMRNEWPAAAQAARQGGGGETTYTREWTPSWSRSPTPPRPMPRHNLPQSMSPSWTPPIAIDKGPVQPENLTVILNNDVNKTKKKEKRKKAEKKSRDEFRKRKRTAAAADRTPPPSKEVFASGDNILVSVSFNKTNEESTVQREVMGVKRKRDSVSDSSKKKKEKTGEKKKKRAKSPRTKKKNKEVANMKPVAIIDLDRSPFKELTPSPKDIIVLSDSDNCEKEDEAMMVHHHEMLQEELMALGAQIQEDSAPQSPNNYLNTTGPKTPPEPQIKFLLTSKQSQLRAINNPLHDPNDEVDPEIDPQEELEHRLDDILHKGPNTPPEPPSSPPSSPDAYDPFDPTKSRSPTPEPPQSQPVLINTPGGGDTKESENDLVDLAVGPLESSAQNLNDSTEKQLVPQRKSTSPERPQTRTPPIVEPSTAESNENIDATDKTSKASPERNPIGVLINQQVQLPVIVKPIIPTSSTVITSTPSIISTLAPRTNLFTAPIGGASGGVGSAPRIATSVPQRIILPTPSKSSPAKMSPLKTSPSKPPIKSTPIKPMPSKTMISKLPVPNMKPLTPIRKGAPAKQPVNSRSNVVGNQGQNGNEVIDVDLDFDSPYSPGSSDYEDLFEPPAETVKTVNTRQQQQNKNTKSPAKQQQNAFDNLFGSSPVFRNNKTNTNNKSKTNAAKIPVKMNKKTANNPKANSKTVGVKIDEDNLKILDDLPNSAVEMQVKDKFLKKLNRQERVVEEVKLVLKPHYNKKHVTKEQYKDILRRAVPKICHNRSGEINPKKIQNLIEAYVKKARHGRKPSNPSGQGGNPIAQQPKPYVISLKRNWYDPYEWSP